MDDTLTLAEALEDLVSAEDFLEYFEIPYEPSVVHVKRCRVIGAPCVSVPKFLCSGAAVGWLPAASMGRSGIGWAIRCR